MTETRDIQRTLAGKDIIVIKRQVVIFAYLFGCFLVLAMYQALLSLGSSFDSKTWLIVLAFAVIRAVVLLALIVMAHEYRLAKTIRDRPVLIWVAYVCAIAFGVMLILSLFQQMAFQWARSELRFDLTLQQFGQSVIEVTLILIMLLPYLMLRGIATLVGDHNLWRLLSRPSMRVGVADATPRPRWWVLKKRALVQGGAAAHH
jgi:hypothetical protein